MTQISAHFTLEELTFSQAALRQGMDNAPPADAVENLGRLCSALLEPIRMLLAVPVHVDSGYRSPAVNAAVGGAKDSAHMTGRAADLVPIGMDLHAAFDAIRNSSLPFDQVIAECNAWIHVAIAADGHEPRRQALAAWGSPGNWHYVEA